MKALNVVLLILGLLKQFILEKDSSKLGSMLAWSTYSKHICGIHGIDDPKPLEVFEGIGLKTGSVSMNY